MSDIRSPHWDAAERIVKFMPSNKHGQIRRVAENIDAVVTVATRDAAILLRSERDALHAAALDINEALEALLPFGHFPYSGEPGIDAMIGAARDFVHKYRPQEDFI